MDLCIHDPEAISLIFARVPELSRKHGANIIGVMHVEKRKTEPLDDSTYTFVPICQAALPRKLDVVSIIAGQVSELPKKHPHVIGIGTVWREKKDRATR